MAAPLAATAAAFTKETGLVVIGLVVARDLLVGREEQRAAPRRAAALYASYLAGAALYLVARWMVLRSLGMPGTPFLENPIASAPALERVATALVVLGKGLQLLVAPVTLSPDYSYAAIPPVTTVLDPRLAGALAGLAVAIAIAAWPGEHRRLRLCGRRVVRPHHLPGIEPPRARSARSSASGCSTCRASGSPSWSRRSSRAGSRGRAARRRSRSRGSRSACSRSEGPGTRARGKTISPSSPRAPACSRPRPRCSSPTEASCSSAVGSPRRATPSRARRRSSRGTRTSRPRPSCSSASRTSSADVQTRRSGCTRRVLAVRAGQRGRALAYGSAALGARRSSAVRWSSGSGRSRRTPAMRRRSRISGSPRTSPAICRSPRRACRAAAEHGRNLAGVWFKLGLVLERRGEREQARAAWRRYLELAPGPSPERDEIARRLGGEPP